jgi:UDP-2-acetamido-3-amino-2,3-dideoxy-glucuronate N-acetyltransferase
MSAYGDRLDFSQSDTVTDSQGHVYQKVGPFEVRRIK